MERDMFLQSFRITGVAVGQIFLLAAIGYFLVKRNFFGKEGLDAISRLVIEVTLPVMIFCQLIRDFSFSAYTHWWVFPLISIAVTASGLVLGALFLGPVKGEQQKLQFLNLIAFQNSGFLPLGLIAALFPAGQRDTLFIYLFLFLLGFNLVMFSVGVHMLSFHKSRRFELGSLFNPPVIAVLLSLLIIFLGWNKFIPDAVIKPLRMAGNCTLPLAMLVVGGNIAEISLTRINKGVISLVVLVKMIILPALGLWLIISFKLPQLVGALILIQLAMPSATTLSVIVRNYKKEDILVSQGIFFTHIISIITVPVFLSLYFARVMLK